MQSGRIHPVKGLPCSRCEGVDCCSICYPAAKHFGQDNLHRSPRTSFPRDQPSDDPRPTHAASTRIDSIRAPLPRILGRESEKNERTSDRLFTILVHLYTTAPQVATAPRSRLRRRSLGLTRLVPLLSLLYLTELETRKPRKWDRYEGAYQERFADRQYRGEKYQLPPRNTRPEPTVDS